MATFIFPQIAYPLFPLLSLVIVRDFIFLHQEFYGCGFAFVVGNSFSLILFNSTEINSLFGRRVGYHIIRH